MQQIGFAPRCCQLPAVVIAISANPLDLIWAVRDRDCLAE